MSKFPSHRVRQFAKKPMQSKFRLYKTISNNHKTDQKFLLVYYYFVIICNGCRVTKFPSHWLLHSELKAYPWRGWPLPRSGMLIYLFWKQTPVLSSESDCSLFPKNKSFLSYLQMMANDHVVPCLE